MAGWFLERGSEGSHLNPPFSLRLQIPVETSIHQQIRTQKPLQPYRCDRVVLGGDSLIRGRDVSIVYGVPENRL